MRARCAHEDREGDEAVQEKFEGEREGGRIWEGSAMKGGDAREVGRDAHDEGKAK